MLNETSVNLRQKQVNQNHKTSRAVRCKERAQAALLELSAAAARAPAGPAGTTVAAGARRAAPGCCDGDQYALLLPDVYLGQVHHLLIWLAALLGRTLPGSPFLGRRGGAVAAAAAAATHVRTAVDSRCWQRRPAGAGAGSARATAAGCWWSSGCIGLARCRLRWQHWGGRRRDRAADCAPSPALPAAVDGRRGQGCNRAAERGGGRIQLGGPAGRLEQGAQPLLAAGRGRAQRGSLLPRILPSTWGGRSPDWPGWGCELRRQALWG